MSAQDIFWPHREIKSYQNQPQALWITVCQKSLIVLTIQIAIKDKWTNYIVPKNSIPRFELLWVLCTLLIFLRPIFGHLSVFHQKTICLIKIIIDLFASFCLSIIFSKSNRFQLVFWNNIMYCFWWTNHLCFFVICYIEETIQILHFPFFISMSNAGSDGELMPLVSLSNSKTNYSQFPPLNDIRNIILQSWLLCSG